MRDEQRDEGAGETRHGEGCHQADPEIGDDIELAETEGIGADAEIGAVTE